MKINELLEAAGVDQTSKDADGNYIGFDQTRKVWVTIPRDVGRNMINRGELANGQLSITTRYPAFNPPAASQSTQPKQASGAPSFGAYAKGQLSQLKPKNIATNVSNKMNQAGIDAIEKLKKVPAAAGDWLDRDERKQRSRGGDFTG
jgi:hypothetical protein